MADAAATYLPVRSTAYDRPQPVLEAARAFPELAETVARVDAMLPSQEG